MESIRLLNKRTGETLDCDIHLSNCPQIVEVEIKGGETIGYFNLEDLANDWEIDFKEDE